MQERALCVVVLIAACGPRFGRGHEPGQDAAAPMTTTVAPTPVYAGGSPPMAVSPAAPDGPPPAVADAPPPFFVPQPAPPPFFVPPQPAPQPSPDASRPSVRLDAALTNQALGRPCASANQCQTGQCVDGVCCDQSCTLPCYACNLKGAEGMCRPVPAGQDPRDACAATPASTCGHDGTCNGTGACRFWPEGAACGAPQCLNAFALSGRACDGSGTCRQPTTMKPCTPYGCAGATCATSCVSVADCAPGHLCTGGRCQ
jgi:hypothetical protein